MDEFQVSVIIPVYNTEKFIVQAIESATTLAEVGEVIVIDDGSSDNTLSICQKLATECSKIKIQHHPFRKNKGRSASRNLGIKNAKSDYIAFLDADDIYLSNRFEVEKIFFLRHQEIDGVYGITSTFFENQQSKEQFINDNQPELIKTTEPIEPENLFEELLWQRKGQFHISAITLKRNIFKKSGMFNPKLWLGEDSDLWYRISAVGKLMSSNILYPVSMRRVHENNTIHTSQIQYNKSRRKYFRLLAKWIIFKKDINYDKKNIALIIMNSYKRIFDKNYTEKLFIIKLLLLYPSILFTKYFFRKIYQLFFKL
jgi:glycosyltransferase involved in cell wall biosynthesis